MLLKKPLIYDICYEAVQGQGSLTYIYLYSNRMNLGVGSVINSYPQIEVSHDVEWRSLNHAWRYGVMACSDHKLKTNEDK